MMNSIKSKRNYLNRVFERVLKEADNGPTSQIVNIEMRIFVEKEASVTDVMTLVRVLQTVAVVGQTDHSLRSKKGRTVIPVSVKFLPETGGLDVNLKKLAERIKSIDDIKVVKIIKVNDRDYYRPDGSRWVF